MILCVCRRISTKHVQYFVDKNMSPEHIKFWLNTEMGPLDRCYCCGTDVEDYIDKCFVGVDSGTEVS